MYLEDCNPMMHPKDIHTLKDAQRHVEGILNDFDTGLATKAETLTHLFNYTVRVMEIAAKATEKKEKE